MLITELELILDCLDFLLLLFFKGAMKKKSMGYLMFLATIRKIYVRFIHVDVT